MDPILTISKNKIEANRQRESLPQGNISIRKAAVADQSI